MKIASLVPSLTEYVADIGLADCLVARTRFCRWPDQIVADVPSIGGTKDPDVDRLRQLEPDLVLLSKEENLAEHAQQIEQFAEILVTDIDSIDSAIQAMIDIGARLGCLSAANQLIARIHAQLDSRPARWHPIPAIYLIWKDPWMTVGGDTYISDVMRHWGLDNLFDSNTRYPQVSPDNLPRSPQLVLASSEPYPFTIRHRDDLSQAFPQCRIEFIDGRWFSWYGSRMVDSMAALTRWRSSLDD